jgi:mono/diheme cytochrome c family protein
MRPNLPPARLARLVAVAGLGGGLLVGCGADADSGAGGPGRQTYLLQCSSCHGADRSGVADAPALPTERMVELGRPQLRSIVTDGVGTMAGFEGVLTTAELDVLVAYLVTGEG